MSQPPAFWLGDRLVRPSLGDIKHGLETLRLEPRSMEVLVALKRSAPDVASKQELIDAVWGDSFVTDVLTHAIWDLRRALGDDASKPEFIQTIPKRGYRLIAPIKEVETGSKTPEDGVLGKAWSRRLAAIALVLASVTAVAVRFTRNERPDPPPDTPRPTLVLTMLPTRSAPARHDTWMAVSGGAWKEDLEARLFEGLRTMRRIHIRRGDNCEPGPDPHATHCLALLLKPRGQGFQLRAELRQPASAEPTYATPAEVFGDQAGLEASAQTLEQLVRACLEVLRDWDIMDPDYRPWVSLQRHDIRAVREFLIGTRAASRDGVGARGAHRRAIELDPDFVAPRVWQTGMVSIAGPPAIAKHLAALDALEDGASEFEMEMIGWSRAYLDDDPAIQVEHLEAALQLEPENRPVQMIMGYVQAQLGNFDDALTRLRSLVSEGWCQPGLYLLSVRLALDQGRIAEAQELLEYSLRCQPGSAHSRSLLLLIAFWQGHCEEAAELERQLAGLDPRVTAADARALVALETQQLARGAQGTGQHTSASRMRALAFGRGDPCS